jgi:hypothetical protein
MFLTLLICELTGLLKSDPGQQIARLMMLEVFPFAVGIAVRVQLMELKSDLEAQQPQAFTVVLLMMEISVDLDLMVLGSDLAVQDSSGST